MYLESNFKEKINKIKDNIKDDDYLSFITEDDKKIITI